MPNANTADGNITAINSALYSYDVLHRLVAANDSAFTLSWQYDANGNRLSQMMELNRELKG